MKNPLSLLAASLALTPIAVAAETKPAAPATPGTPQVAPAAEAPDPKRLSQALGTFFANRQKSGPQGEEKMDFAQVKKGMQDVLSSKNADYAAGAQMASQLMRDRIEVDLELVMEAFQAVMEGREPLVSQADMQGELQRLNQMLQARAMEAQQRASAKNEAEGAAFLEKNRSAEGVKTTESGLQYKVLQAAKDPNAPRPTADDSVTCAYRGTLLDGTEFDKSPDGQPRTFNLRQVVKGWTEGIPLMQAGSKYRFWVPASLGYGNNPRGGVIKPGSTLVFDVELDRIEPKVSSATPPGAADPSVQPQRGEKAVATTPPIAVEMKNGKPTVTQVTPEQEAAAKKKAQEKAQPAPKAEKK